MKKIDHNEEKPENEIENEIENEEELNSLEFESPEDLQRFLHDISTSEPGKKRKVIGISSHIIKNDYLNSLAFLVINTFLILAINGYFKILLYSNIYYLWAFIGILTIIDIISKEIVYRHFPFLIFMTFGVLLLIINLLSFIIPLLLFKTVYFRRVSDFIIFFLIFSLARFLITQYFIQRRRIKITKSTK